MKTILTIRQARPQGIDIQPPGKYLAPPTPPLRTVPSGASPSLPPKAPKAPDDGTDDTFTKMQIAATVIIPVVVLIGLLLLVIGVEYLRSHRRRRLRGSRLWSTVLSLGRRRSDGGDTQPIRQMEEALPPPPSLCYDNVPQRTPPRAMRLSDPPQLDIDALGVREIRREASRRQSKFSAMTPGSRRNSLLAQIAAPRWSIFRLSQDEMRPVARSDSILWTYRTRGPSTALDPGPSVENPRLLIPAHHVSRRMSRVSFTRPGKGFRWGPMSHAYRGGRAHSHPLGPSALPPDIPSEATWPPAPPYHLRTNGASGLIAELPASIPDAMTPHGLRRSVRIVSKSPTPGRTLNQTHLEKSRIPPAPAPEYDAFVNAREEMVRRIRGDRGCSTFSGNCSRSSSRAGRRLRERDNSDSATITADADSNLTVPAADAAAELASQKRTPPLPERLRPRLSVEETHIATLQSLSRQAARIRARSIEIVSRDPEWLSPARRNALIQPASQRPPSESFDGSTPGLQRTRSSSLDGTVAHSHGLGHGQRAPGGPERKSRTRSASYSRDSWVTEGGVSDSPAMYQPWALPVRWGGANRAGLRESWNSTAESIEEEDYESDTTASPGDARGLELLPSTRYGEGEDEGESGGAQPAAGRVNGAEFAASLGFVDIGALAARSAQLEDREMRLRALEDAQLLADGGSRGRIAEGRAVGTVNRRGAAAASVSAHIRYLEGDLETSEWGAADSNGRQGTAGSRCFL